MKSFRLFIFCEVFTSGVVRKDSDCWSDWFPLAPISSVRRERLITTTNLRHHYVGVHRQSRQLRGFKLIYHTLSIVRLLLNSAVISLRRFHNSPMFPSMEIFLQKLVSARGLEGRRYGLFGGVAMFKRISSRLFIYLPVCLLSARQKLGLLGASSFSN